MTTPTGHGPAAAALCSFYVRALISDGPPPTYRYDAVDVASPLGDGALRTPYPPAVGDLIHLGAKTYRVIDRALRYAQYGSARWPVQLSESPVGPDLTVIVTPEAGPFVGEAEQTPS